MWRGKRRLDGPSIDGQDGHNDTGQEKRGKLVHIAHADEYHQYQENQESCAIDTHVIKHGCRFFESILTAKDGSPGNNIHLPGRRRRK